MRPIVVIEARDERHAQPVSSQMFQVFLLKARMLYSATVSKPSFTIESLTLPVRPAAAELIYSPLGLLGVGAPELTLLTDLSLLLPLLPCGLPLLLLHLGLLVCGLPLLSASLPLLFRLLSLLLALLSCRLPVLLHLGLLSLLLALLLWSLLLHLSLLGLLLALLPCSLLLHLSLLRLLLALLPCSLLLHLRLLSLLLALLSRSLPVLLDRGLLPLLISLFAPLVLLRARQSARACHQGGAGEE